MALESTLEHGAQIDSEILAELKRLGTCTFSELGTALPAYTWNQVFGAVDRLSREGRLRLTRNGRFDYRISKVPHGPGQAAASHA